jgi:hypothetical protein
MDVSSMMYPRGRIAELVGRCSQNPINSQPHQNHHSTSSKALTIYSLILHYIENHAAAITKLHASLSFPPVCSSYLPMSVVLGVALGGGWMI